MDNPESKKKNSNKWLALINIPLQMGIIIFAFAFLGSWLDENHPSTTFAFKKILIMVGVALAMYNVHRQVTNIQS